jgi:hypothetical protein
VLPVAAIDPLLTLPELGIRLPEEEPVLAPDPPPALPEGDASDPEAERLPELDVKPDVSGASPLDLSPLAELALWPEVAEAGGEDP